MQSIKTPGGREVVFVNPEDSRWNGKPYGEKFVLYVGQISPTFLVIWAKGICEASEIMCDWCVDNAPGYLCDEYMQEEYDRAIAEGKSEDEAREIAEMDVTVFGHSGFHGIQSDHWGIWFENPGRHEMLTLLERPEACACNRGNPCDIGHASSECHCPRHVAKNATDALRKR